LSASQTERSFADGETVLCGCYSADEQKDQRIAALERIVQELKRVLEAFAAKQ